MEILEIRKKINNKQDSNTISDTQSIVKQLQSNRNEPPTSENINTTQPNNTEQTLTQEQIINLENLKRIMNTEKKEYLTIIKQHRMENSENGKNKSITNLYIYE